MDVNLNDLKLNERQATFAKEYAVSGNGTQSAIAAKYSPNGAAVASSKLLKVPKVKAAIDRIRQAIVAKATEQERVQGIVQQGVDQGANIAMTAENIMVNLAQMGMTQATLKKFLQQKNGHLYYDFSTASREELDAISAQIGEVKFTCTTSVKKDGSQETVINSQLKWVDRKGILELMGKYREIMAWREKIEIDVPDNLAARLVAGRERVRMIERPSLEAVNE